METQAEPAEKNEDMKSKKDENEKKEKGGGGEAAARENLETSETLIAKIAHQLFSHLLGVKVCFQETTINSHSRRTQHDTLCEETNTIVPKRMRLPDIY